MLTLALIACKPNLPTAPVGPTPEEGVPTDATVLLPWLEDGSYDGWEQESGPHDSTGPHFGDVLTFVNPALFDSLSVGGSAHPEGAAAVKELYGDGTTVRGWSVMVKVAPDAGAGNWYWYEVYDTDVFGDGVGDATCTGCHDAGTDAVRTPFPLQ